MFKLFSKPTVLAAAMLALSLPALAQSQTPAISMHVDENVMLGENFAMKITTLEKTTIEVDAGNGRQKFTVDPAGYDASTGEYTSTLVTFPIGKGDIKIYGDGSLIDYMDLSQMYITSISMPTLKNLQILNMDHNQLGSLDLTGFSKLASLTLNDNPFNVSPLKIGGNKPDLMILELAMIPRVSEDFNISDYPNLRSFIAYSNYGFNHIDPTGCPLLQQLSIDCTNVSHLDISKNPELLILNISDTRVTDIDLSTAPKLREFYAQHQSGTINPDIKLQSIDLTHNPELVYLYLAGNDFTALDLSKNTKVQMLNISHNHLSGVDFSPLTQLIEPNISFNYMCFATMPLPDQNWSDYIWQQHDWQVRKSYPVNGTIDFSETMLIPNTVTSLMLMKDNPKDSMNPIMLSPGKDFNFDSTTGVLTFLTEQPDSIYAQIVNSAFTPTSTSPWINTTKFVVKSAEEYGKPILRSSFTGFSTGEQVALQIGCAGASPENPKKVLIDFGSYDENAKPVEYTITTDQLPATANVVGPCQGNEVKIYADEYVDITALGIHHQLYTINVGKMDQLRYLDLQGCGLYSEPSLSMTRYLRTLNLADNNLYSINLAGATDAVNKVHLNDINLANNHLSTFSVPDNRTLVNLDLSGNQIEEISFRDADNLSSLNISNNRLQRLDIHYSLGIKNLDASNNRLNEINLPETLSPESVNLSNNEFTLTSLPAPSVIGSGVYTYAPQAMIPLPVKGPGANLSVQNVRVDGKATQFKWFKADGTPLVEGTDYTVTAGNTRFLNTTMGKVYCEITNGAFPQLTLRTSEIEAAGMPTNKLAEFKTPEGGQNVALSVAALSGNTAIYIDWAGDGNLDQYLLKDTYTIYNATTVKDALVKVYTYDTNDRVGVFSITGATMENLDASGLVDAFCLNFSNAGLSSAKFPENARVTELTLDGNEFSDMSQIPFDKWTNLMAVSLNDNQFTSFDASKLKSLQILSLGNNNISQITLDNPLLYFLSLSDNRIREFSYDISKTPQLEQLGLSHNFLKDITIPENAPALKALTLDHNNFNFATLPLKRDQWVIYTYHAQALVEPASNVDGKVDFSYTAKAKDGTETRYTWYVGEVAQDSFGNPVMDENGTIQAELLAEDQYSVENGVTTFLGNYPELTCVMTNPTLDKCYLISIPIKVTVGIDDVMAPEDVRLTVSGNTLTVTAPRDFEAALYAINGQLAGKAQLVDGTATFENLASGVYVLATPAGAYRILVK